MQPERVTREEPENRPGGMQAVWHRGDLADVPAVAEFAAGAFDPGFREAWNQGQIAAMVADPCGWLDLARYADGDRPGIAAFSLSRQILDDVELLLCAISPASRRMGLGRHLIARVAEESARRGAQRVFLEVRASNTAALALYQSCGFVWSGRRPAYYRSVAGESIDAITLIRSI